jgi:hypothetical protein
VDRHVVLFRDIEEEYWRLAIQNGNDLGYDLIARENRPATMMRIAFADACTEAFAMVGTTDLEMAPEIPTIMPPEYCPPGYVRIPMSEEEAAMMALLGTNWLEENAPHRLKKNAV